MDEITKPGGALRLDIDGDGQVTIMDVPGWVVEVFFMPGDWLIWALITYAPPVARFLELGPGDYGGVLSATVSGLSWLALVMLAVVAYRAVYNLDQALTAWLRRGYETLRWRLRIAARLLAARLDWRGQREARGREGDTVELSEGVDVTESEFRVLELHAELGPGYALAADDVASALELGRRRTAAILERLVKLHLLDTAFGGHDGETSYALTRAGRAYLSYRQLS